MNNSVIDALNLFFSHYHQIWQQTAYPKQAFDELWLSDCHKGSPKNGEIEWQPVKRNEQGNFDNLTQALEIPIHSDISDFYGSYFSDPLPALFDDHPITLIQAWNPEDFENLQENMIRHLLMQQQLKQPASLFLATTDDEMEIVSMNNDTGEVIVERLGQGQVSLLSSNLAEFIKNLKPVT